MSTRSDRGRTASEPIQDANSRIREDRKMENGADNSVADGGNIGKSIQLFTPSEVRVLQEAEVTTIARFIRDRSRYELQSEVRRSEVKDLTTMHGRQVLIQKYWSIISSQDFWRYLPRGGELRTSNRLASVTIHQISNTERVVGSWHSDVILEAIRGVRMDMTIRHPESRVLTYVTALFP